MILQGSTAPGRERIPNPVKDLNRVDLPRCPQPHAHVEA